MTVTEYGYCAYCDTRRVELVPTEEKGLVSCSRCGSLNIYDSKAEYERLKED